MKKKIAITIIIGIIISVAIYRIQEPVLHGDDFTSVMFTVIDYDGSKRAVSYSVTDKQLIYEICALLNEQEKTTTFNKIVGAPDWEIHLNFYAGMIEKYSISITSSRIEYKGTIMRKSFVYDNIEKLKSDLTEIGRCSNEKRNKEISIND